MSKPCNKSIAPEIFCKQDDPEKCDSELRKAVGCVDCNLESAGYNSYFVYGGLEKVCRSGARREHCPVYVQIQNRDCRLYQADDRTQYFGELGGPEARCFMSSWWKVEKPLTFSLPDGSSSNRRTRCFDVVCASDKKSYNVYMSEGQKRVNIGICTEAGQVLLPADSAEIDTSSYNTYGDILCHHPVFVCKPTSDFFNSQSFVSPPPPRARRSTTTTSAPSYSNDDNPGDEPDDDGYYSDSASTTPSAILALMATIVS